MAIKVAQSARMLPPPILLLGVATQNRLLAESLRTEGFEVVFPAGHLQTLEQLEENLLHFHDQYPDSGFVHPGHQFWGGRPELFHLCQKMGLNLISPSASVLSLFANRLSLLDRAQQVKIPHLVLDFEPMSSRREAEHLYQKLNRPAVLQLRSALRARLGCHSFHFRQDRETPMELDLWLEQLSASTGEAIFFAEKYLGESRRISLAFCRKVNGLLQFLPAIDQSLQVTSFGRQKPILTVCPAPQLSASALQKMQDYSQPLLDSIRFVGVGSLEFLVDGDRPYLVDGCAQLESNFSLWEKQAGISAVRLQLEAMDNQSRERKSDAGGNSSNSSVSCSITLYADDPHYQIPRPGRIHEQKILENSNHKETEAFGRSHCLFYYDAPAEIAQQDSGELAQIIAHGQHLEDSLQQLHSQLSKIWIAGSMQSNQRYLLSLLQHAWVKEGIFHSRFLDEEFVPDYHHNPELLQSLALLAGKVLRNNNPPSDGAWSLGGRLIPQQDIQTLHTGRIELWRSQSGSDGLTGTVHFPKWDPRPSPFLLYPLAENCWLLTTSLFSGLARFIPKATEKSERYALYAQTSGQIHSLLYQEDRRVPAHQALLIIRSLDNLVPHALPSSVDLLEWLVRPGQAVVLGEKLAWFKKSAK